MANVYIESYGCQMNLSDAEILQGILTRAGFAPVRAPEEADVILVNTCAIRENAEERVLGRITHLSGLRAGRPGMLLGLLGCMAQHWGRSLLRRAPAVDLVVGPDGYRDVPRLIAEIRAGGARRAHTRLLRRETYGDLLPDRSCGVSAWVPVMRGCNEFCTFCIVPYVRGRERYRPPEEVLREVQGCVERGFREVVLLGQNINSYRSEGVDLAGLLQRVGRVDGLLRVRFLTSHPRYLSGAIIEAMASTDRVCPHLHLPVQSGSDGVLGRMGRRYTRAEYSQRVAALRRAIPHIALSTDIIVGFPGETEEDFQTTLDLMDELVFDSAFTFRFSPREGTRAAAFRPAVPPEVAAERLDRVIARQKEHTVLRLLAKVGSSAEVLVEGRARRGGTDLWGRAADFTAVVFPPGGALPGGLLRVRITGTTGATLIGRPLETASSLIPLGVEVA